MNKLALEYAYLGGIFDGEGTIGIYKRKPANGTGHHTFALKCSVIITQEYIPRLFQFNFGGSVSQRKDGMWAWYIGAKKGESFLKILIP